METSGIDAFVTKPIKASPLQAVLASVLGMTLDDGSVDAAESAIDPELGARYPLRILLAEDNMVNQQLALRLLEKLGYRSDVAANGIEALEALERQTYDLLLTDVQMPEMDGVEATRRIVERWAPDARPRIVAMTAEAMQGDRERFLAAGMDDYLMKPVRIEELVASIKATPRRPDADVPVTVEAVPATSGGPVDERVVHRLRESTGGDDTFVSDLIGQFLSDAPALVETMWAALERDDASEVHRAAHTLKSNAATFGAQRLAEMCRELEATSKDGSLSDAASRIDAIAVELGLVRVVLMAADPHRDQPEDG